MTDHFELTLADLLAEIAKDEDAVRAKKRTVNALCAMKSRPAAFLDVLDESSSASTAALKGDEYFGKKQHTACRMVLERRRALNLGPATVDDFFRELTAGGYPFVAKSDDIAKKGLSNMLSQNTAVFIKLPNGKFSLREWYPNARKPVDRSKSDAGASDETVGRPETDTEDGSIES